MSLSQFDERIPVKGEIMKNELYKDYKIGLLTFYAQNAKCLEQLLVGDDAIIENLLE
jgi:hypothetical protein